MTLQAGHTSIKVRVACQTGHTNIKVGVTLATLVAKSKPKQTLCRRHWFGRNQIKHSRPFGTGHLRFISWPSLFSLVLLKQGLS